MSSSVVFVVLFVSSLRDEKKLEILLPNSIKNRINNRLEFEKN
jgi:hypothetical protein